ncbi:MAG: hypothetical protein GC171_01725 [Terrimonas sp.]|nr:hypothetical protein [Terrimonas sp.]
MKNWVLKNKWILTGVLLGALGGYFYWQQIGCASGTCLITSHWQNSTVYGAIMGGLLLSSFKKEKKHGNKSEKGNIQ